MSRGISVSASFQKSKKPWYTFRARAISPRDFAARARSTCAAKSDYRFSDDPAAAFEPVKVDRRLKEGDKIELGGVVITAHLHPGYTRGATSFTFDVRENNKSYRIGIMNMPSINPGLRVSGMPKFPDTAQAYARTFHDQKETKIDVWLAQFDMHKKCQPGDPYNPDPFVDPQGFQTSVAQLEKLYREQLAKEQQGK